MFSADVLRGRRASTTKDSTGKQDAGNEFFKVIAVDFSSLELRFENVFTRLAAIETRLDLKEKHPTRLEVESSDATTHTEENAEDEDFEESTGDGDKVPHENTEDTPSSGRDEDVSEPAVDEANSDIDTDTTDRNVGKPDADSTFDGGEPVAKHKVYTDAVTLAQKIESLRAAQLRLKIDQEVARSALVVDMVKLRNDLENRQQTDLIDFREEVMAASNASTKLLQNEYQKLAQSMYMSLSELKLAENRWKSTFEETMAARIQDIWSGLHSTSRKLQENMQYLQTEMVTQEESSREVNTFVESMRASTERLDRDNKKHAKKLADQEKDMEHLHGMCTQAAVRIDEQDSKLKSEVGMLYQQLERADGRVQEQTQRYQSFVDATNNSFTILASDITTCNSSLTAHQTMLRSLDTTVKRHGDDIVRLEDRVALTDAKIGSIDGRVALTEKKMTTTVGVMQEHYQERQQVVAALQASINQAALERTAIKHATSDLGFSVQETQQKLNEVTKLASTTDLALARTAAELPKLHALVTTNSSNIAKNRQSVRDITTMIEDDRKVANTFHTAFEKEVTDSVARFTAAESRDAQAQNAIANAVRTAGDVKSELQATILKNSNLIHQLNTMVDSLAITETTEDMEDKMSSFALACAQLGLKLEFFGRKASSMDGACVLKDDVKASLAILLTKVIRFLGSGVSIDQNKYLLTAKRAQAVDPVSGQVIIEMPPQHVLESFRIAKAAAFTAKTRLAMDQLQPVVRTNRTSIEFRDAFERKLRFVLEFGLANLFPNMGKPKNPASRRDSDFGTCIACDRPLDCDDPQPEDADMPPMRHRAQQQNSSSPRKEDSMHERNSSSVQQDSTSSRPSSAAMRTRIDTKTPVRGRSGSSIIRPKSNGDSMHYTPGTGEYVYRGGFRIPKSNPNALLSNSVTSLIALSVASTTSVLVEKPEESNGGPFDTDNSFLEKVALQGKFQVVEIPSIGSISGVGGGAAAVRAARPHTAPQRMKSLPRLEVSTLNIDPTPASPPATLGQSTS